jgi:hypothetical protein
MHNHHNASEPPSGNLRYWIGGVGFTAVIAILLYTGHGAHLLGALPYLLLLACPLLHVFMHGGHGGHNHNKSDKE